MSMRKLAPCGTFSAYRRHLRRGEEIDEACRIAARENSRRQKERERERRVENGKQLERHLAAPGAEAGQEFVKQIVSHGKSVDISVPLQEDPLESARWRLVRIRAAMLIASPRDVAPLAKAEQDAISEISRLSVPAEQTEKVSALDQIAAKRAERLAEAAG